MASKLTAQHARAVVLRMILGYDDASFRVGTGPEGMGGV